MNKEDNVFIQKLKELGYKTFQRFKGEKISENGLDTYIQRCLNKREFEQFGVKKDKLSKAIKEKIQLKEHKPQAYKDVEKKPAIFSQKASELSREARIRTTPDYIRLRNEHGEEAAEFVFFNIKQ